MDVDNNGDDGGAGDDNGDAGIDDYIVETEVDNSGVTHGDVDDGDADDELHGLLHKWG